MAELLTKRSLEISINEATVDTDDQPDPASVKRQKVQEKVSQDTAAQHGSASSILANADNHADSSAMRLPEVKELARDLTASHIPRSSNVTSTDNYSDPSAMKHKKAEEVYQDAMDRQESAPRDVLHTGNYYEPRAAQLQKGELSQDTFTLKASPSSFPILLSNMPPRVLRCIIGHLIQAPVPGLMDSQSIVHARTAYELCSQNSLMYEIFLSFMNSLNIIGGHQLEVQMKPFARMLSHSLRHLKIHISRASLELLLALAPMNVPLATLMFTAFCHRSLQEEKTLFVGSLTDVVLSSQNELRVLHLGIRYLDVEIDCEILAPALKNLVVLSVAYADVGVVLDLVTLVSCSKERLRHLKLNNVVGLTEDTFIGIGGTCPEIARLELYNVRDVPPSHVRDFAIFLGPALSHYDFWNPSPKPPKGIPKKALREPSRVSSRIPCVFANELYMVMSRCPNLAHVTLDARPQQCIPRTLEALALRASTLRSLRISMNTFPLDAVTQIKNEVCGLRELELAGYCAESTFAEFCTQIGPRLHVLICRCTICPSDPLLRAISSCKGLLELTLNITNSNNDSMAQVGYEAVEEMLKGVGTNLRMLTWNLFIRWDNPVWPKLEHASEILSGCDLAKYVWSYCQNLELLQVERMRPRYSCCSRFEMAFRELCRRLPNVELYLQRQRPLWLDRTWSGEGIEY